MAKNPAKNDKEPGRVKQIIDLIKATIKFKKINILFYALAIVLPIVAVVLIIIFTNADIWGLILWPIVGILAAFVFFMMVLNRRIQDTFFRQLEGQPGGTGAVLKAAFNSGAWQTSELPVAIVPKSQEGVYRAVGKPGVVLVLEGNSSRGQKILADETRKVQRVIPNIEVHTLSVGKEEGQVRLYEMPKTIKKFPKKLKKYEVQAVFKRLESLTSATPLPIPKGIDPLKVRAPRPR